MSTKSQSKSIKVDQSRSKSIKVDQSRSKSIQVDPSRSKSIQVDQSRSSRSKSINIRSKVDQIENEIKTRVRVHSTYVQDMLLSLIKMNTTGKNNHLHQEYKRHFVSIDLLQMIFVQTVSSQLLFSSGWACILILTPK
jgi:hypothetical protein